MPKKQNNFFKNFFTKQKQEQPEMPTEYMFNTPYAVWMRSKKHAWWIIIVLGFVAAFFLGSFIQLGNRMHNEWASQNPAYLVEDEFRNINSKNLQQILLYKAGMENTFLDRAIDRSKQKYYESAIAKIPEEDGERYVFLYDKTRNELFKTNVNLKTKRVFFNVFKGLIESPIIKNDYYNSVRKLLIMQYIFIDLSRTSHYHDNIFTKEEVDFLVDKSIETLQNTDIDLLILESDKYRINKALYGKELGGSGLVLMYLNYLYEHQVAIRGSSKICNKQYVQTIELVVDTINKLQNPKTSISLGEKSLLLKLKNNVQHHLDNNQQVMDNCFYAKPSFIN